MTDLIFKYSRSGRGAGAQIPKSNHSTPETLEIPAHLLRQQSPNLPEVSELQVVRHFTQLSQKNFSIDTHFYPLGSCTMKYNPRGAHKAASFPGFLARHPLAPMSHSQGFLACLYELQEILKVVTGMAGVSLAPMAGAQGEFVGVAMIKAYHDARQDSLRQRILIPTAAHGTNPATARMCGYVVDEISVTAAGDLDLAELERRVGPDTAGLMITNPSTCGVFERQIDKIAAIVHAAGGLMYYDGANFNAVMGRVKPAAMGFDVLHLNLHKTFATPHGGGGPGAGPVAVNEKLLPFLPIPTVLRDQDDAEVTYGFSDLNDCPQSIGRLSTFMGNAGVLLRAYFYARLLGQEGMCRVSEYAVLNANYVMRRLQQAGFTLAYPSRRATHEFLITLSPQQKKLGINALDFAKRLLDYGIHAPTIYFPLIVPECWLIEPTETETKETLDAFIAVMVKLLEEAESDPDLVKSAPQRLGVGRMDEVAASRKLDVTWDFTKAESNSGEI